MYQKLIYGDFDFVRIFYVKCNVYKISVYTAFEMCISLDKLFTQTLETHVHFYMQIYCITITTFLTKYVWNMLLKGMSVVKSVRIYNFWDFQNTASKLSEMFYQFVEKNHLYKLSTVITTTK